MTGVSTRARSFTSNRGHVVVAALIVLALLYPQIVDSLASIPVIGDFVPATDSMVVMIAFTAAVLGGIGNLTGAVLGALLIGFIQAFNEGLAWFAPGSDWTRSMVFGILILVLVFRPEGILGEQTPEGA